MKDVMVNIAGAIGSAAILAIGAALWKEVFAPLWAVSPERFVILCTFAALIGSGIACSISITVARRRAKAAVERMAELEAERNELAEKVAEYESEPNWDEQCRSTFFQLPDNDLRLLAKFRDAGGSLLLPDTDTALNDLVSRGIAHRIEDGCYVPPNSYMFRVSPLMMAMLRTNGEMIEQIANR